MKQNQLGIQRQQTKQFLWELLSFAVLFTVLGLIVFILFRQSIFRNVDQSLQTQEKVIKDGPDNHDQPLRAIKQPPRGRDRVTAGPFQANILVYNHAGKILNQASLGSRLYTYFKNIKLAPNTVNQKTTLITNAGIFRTLLIKVPGSNSNPAYAGHYVLILLNIDSEYQSISTFRNVLIITVFIFFLLAVGLAYWLSKITMRPIVASWQRQQTFVADAAHELRAPLAVIQSKQEYLLTKPTRTIVDESEAIATSLDETRRLRQLTDDLLTIARSDSNSIVVQPSEVDLGVFFTKLLQPYQAIAQSQHKALSTQLPNGITVKLDQKLIHQLMVILLDNALKYTEPGESIWVHVTSSHNRWQLPVGNSGQGLSEAEQAHIFDRFYRADASRNRQTGGSGLGLSIAKWIVNQHHGQISVCSVEPRGLEFVTSFISKFK